MATIVHGAGNDRPGTITVEASRAVEVARGMVRDGLRNEAWASVGLPDGRTYHVVNRHGRAVAHYVGH